MSRYNLEDKILDVEGLARSATSDEDLLKELLAGVKSKDNTIRSNSFQVLLIVSRDDPEFLYPQWDFFYDMLLSSNSYHKYIAIYILANLTQADTEDKFMDIFDDYFQILSGDEVMNASHVAINTPTIIKNRPELESEIVDILLNVEKINPDGQSEHVKPYIIEALRKIYPLAEDKEKIKEFVESQLVSPNSQTRDLASCFLDKF